LIDLKKLKERTPCLILLEASFVGLIKSSDRSLIVNAERLLKE
jgi:hypothetical protein